MRRLLGRLLATSLLIGAAPAPAQESGPGYKPQDKDERGLWMQVDEQERQIKTSSFVIRDPALNAYVNGVFCRTVGEAACKDARIYIVRVPYFNASMAPNGMIQVWSGLLLRVRNEAQLAAVLGHEYTHYQNRHALKLFRDIKQNTGAASFLMVGGIGGALVGLAILTQSFEYSRDNEREADAGGVALIAKAGYDPAAAPMIWEQVRQEQEATAAARNVKPRYQNGGLFATHPNNLERMRDMRAQATAITVPNAVTNEEAYRKALSPWWPQFFDDQIKLNDFGGGEFLLGQLASAGWTPALLFARGELYRARGQPEDLVKAAGFYRQAVDSEKAPPEAWRGLGLALLRQGKRDEGQSAIKTYLQKKPDATDKAMMAMLAGDPS